jgi:carbon storage regulator
MLVLTRRVGEAVVIEGGIRVEVNAVLGDRVRLAIEAPRSTRVDREEVHERRMEFAAEGLRTDAAAQAGCPVLS